MICESCVYNKKKFCYFTKIKIKEKKDCFFYEEGELNEENISNNINHFNEFIWSSDENYIKCDK